MAIILLVALTVFVIGGMWLMLRPRQPTTNREQKIDELRAAGVRGRLDAIIDLEEQPPRRFVPRIVYKRRR